MLLLAHVGIAFAVASARATRAQPRNGSAFGSPTNSVQPPSPAWTGGTDARDHCRLNAVAAQRTENEIVEERAQRR